MDNFGVTVAIVVSFLLGGAFGILIEGERQNQQAISFTVSDDADMRAYQRLCMDDSNRSMEISKGKVEGEFVMTCRRIRK